MAKKALSLALLTVLGTLAAYPQFSVTMKGSGEVRKVEADRFLSEDDTQYTFGGIDVADIASIQLGGGDKLTPLPENACKPVYIIDMNPAAEQSERNLYSAEYMVKIAGLPYVITQSVDEAAANASMILLAARVQASSFTAGQWQALAAFVDGGGVLVSPGIEANIAAAKSLFGISARVTEKAHATYSWTETPLPETVYFDTPEEKTVSLARRASNTISTTAYTVDTALPLAHYDDDPTAVAVIKNRYGKGVAYAFGVRWRDVIQRSHLNKDFEAQRGSSNAFDPSADVYSFFIRAAHAANNPVSAWKYTVPEGYKAVLIPTHDCDSRTAYDEMHYLADYEQSLGLRAHYFLTVHYFRQAGYMSAFYDEASRVKVQQLLDAGHTIGSHSLCHFPDFNLAERFPMTEVTEEEYALTAERDLENGVSSGSTWAELVLSKNILERDFARRIRAFRSGHLCVNSLMPEAHKIAGYAFSSCYTASDVLSQFPFPQRMRNDWTGEETGVLQMPLHFSDVFSGDNSMNESNWQEKVEIWTEIFNKLKDNYASSILLIHPNREWKMLSQKALIDTFDREECGVYNFEDYGDFWLGRDAFTFESFYDAEHNSVTLRAPAASIAANPALSICVETTVAPAAITLIDETDTIHPIDVKPLGANRFLVRL